jgi:hypothetical protein
MPISGYPTSRSSNGGLVVDPAVGRERLDPCFVFRESVRPQLLQNVFRRVPISARSLDPVVTADLDHVVLRDLAAQCLVEKISALRVQERRKFLGTDRTRGRQQDCKRQGNGEKDR